MADAADDEWDRAEEAMKNMKLAGNNLSNPPPEESVNDEIDSALLDTLDNPRERMNVLKYEDRILRFVQTSDSILDVPPISNSFQRLLIYRVAQRFGLEHNASESANEAGDRGILLFKTERTKIPDPLLINLRRGGGSGEQASTSPVATSGEQPSKANKIKVMKRNTPHKNSSKKSSSADQGSSSVSEREKAYAEARARIFGSEDVSSDAAPPTLTPSTAPPAAPSQQPGTAPPQNTQKSSGGAGGGGRRAVVNAGSWKQKKVTMRNKDAERFDPDFARLAPRAGPAYGPGGPPFMGPPMGPYGQPLYPPQQGMWSPNCPPPPGPGWGGEIQYPPRGPPSSAPQNFVGSFEYQPHSQYSSTPTPPPQTGATMSKDDFPPLG